jgi:hypothetical protein
MMRGDGRLANYPRLQAVGSPVPDLREKSDTGNSEDWVKSCIQKWLVGKSWSVEVAWGRAHGCDILAKRSDIRWCIEAKGMAKHSTMRHNYFCTVIFQALQHHVNGTICSVALPAIPQYITAWKRLSPSLKKATGLTALFVEVNGAVWVT